MEYGIYCKPWKFRVRFNFAIFAIEILSRNQNAREILLFLLVPPRYDMAGRFESDIYDKFEKWR